MVVEMVGDGYADELCGESSGGFQNGRIELEKKGIHFLHHNSADELKMMGGFGEKSDSLSKRAPNLSSQELTLSYLCENSKLGGFEKDITGQNMVTSLNGRFKGKEAVVFEDRNDEEKKAWLERDFLQLNGHRGNSSKRDAENVEGEGEIKGKKPKVESLNLSLALPDVSLSLARSDKLQNMNLPSHLKPSRSLQSLGPSCNNTRMTYSNDFTAVSLSQSCSFQISHNPSCSLTKNSTENYGSDQIWNCGEGTNGSVHSRFRPIGDGNVALSNHGDARVFGNRISFLKDQSVANSGNVSFLPSELPAKPRMDSQSGDLRANLESVRDSDDMDVINVSRLSGSERILREIVSESIRKVSSMMKELSDETVASLKEYLKNMINSPQRKDELITLQKKLARRSDLTKEALSKSYKTYIEILVTIKTGLSSYLDAKNQLPAVELVEIFSLDRCRNINCRRLLPVDDCDCKICSSKKGFCSECTCPVCFKFDCGSNTCSWVGCDTCSHWCHASCGLQKNLIKPGPFLTGASEMQFHCLCCGHASEMFGFVKDVFMSCAENWGVDSLSKELDYVKKIFQGSEDGKGKELHFKADEMLTKLQNKKITAPEVCHAMFQFFNSADSFREAVSSAPVSRNLVADQRNGRLEAAASFDFGHSEKIIEDEWSVKPVKKDGFKSLDDLVRVKEAEARMFQNRADEARREIDSYKRLMRLQNDKLDEEYGEKMAKLCLEETEAKLKKKIEEVKLLENSHRDYYKMKIRMQFEICALLKRMEVTKQQLV